jgi:hypothetical protein
MQHADAAKALGDDGDNTMGAVRQNQPLCCLVPRGKETRKAHECVTGAILGLCFSLSNIELASFSKFRQLEAAA